MTLPELFIGLYSVALLLAGITCLILDARRSGKSDTPNLQAWNVKVGDFLILYVLTFAVQFFAAGAVTRTLQQLGYDEASIALFTLPTLALQLAPLLVVILALKFYPQQYPANFNSRRMQGSEALKLGMFFFLSSIPIMAVVSLSWEALLQLLIDYGWDIKLPVQEVVSIFAEQDSPLVIAVMIFMIVVMAPLVEEILFRGMLYRFFKGRMGNLVALTFSSLFFALLHANLLKLIPLFLLGMLLGRAYEKSGSLLVPIFMHAFFNLSTVLVLLITPEALKM